jgi:hypothetical protein
MKTGKILQITFVLILVVAFCVQAQKEMPQHEDEPLLIGRINPTLEGIEEFYVLIEANRSMPNEGGLDCKKLDAQVKEKFEKENMKAAFVKDTPNMASMLPKSMTGDLPALIVYMDLLRLEESQMYVYHIQTFLKKKAYLSRDDSSFIKVGVWETGREMEAVSFRDMPSKVTEVVFRQVDAFIRAYKTANPVGNKTSDTENNIIMNIPQERAESKVDTATAGYIYIASKNSSVFHKSDCRWAQNISEENRVTYNSREEAIKAGKRPCKTCNP